jgi:multiple antibiotic resistance protein
VSGVLDLEILVSMFVTLLVIMDPPGILPVFLGLTKSLTHRQRVGAARRAALVAFGVITAFALFGQQILQYLHISLPALQGAGGLLLLLVALELLTGKESEQHADVGVNVAMVPLGTPLLAGPGAIVATMLAVQKADRPGEYAAVGLALLGALLVVWLFLRFAGRVHGLLRDSGTTLLTRIAGLLLSAIAVQMLANSVRAFVSGEG